MPERHIAKIECPVQQVFPLGKNLHTHAKIDSVGLLRDGRVSVGRLFDKYIFGTRHDADLIFYRWDKGGHINPQDQLIIAASDYDRLCESGRLLAQEQGEMAL